MQMTSPYCGPLNLEDEDSPVKFGGWIFLSSGVNLHPQIRGYGSSGNQDGKLNPRSSSTETQEETPPSPEQISLPHYISKCFLFIRCSILHLVTGPKTMTAREVARFKNSVETAPRNCRFLSLVLVERVLMITQLRLRVLPTLFM